MGDPATGLDRNPIPIGATVGPSIRASVSCLRRSRPQADQRTSNDSGYDNYDVHNDLPSLCMNHTLRRNGRGDQCHNQGASLARQSKSPALKRGLADATRAGDSRTNAGGEQATCHQSSYLLILNPKIGWTGACNKCAWRPSAGHVGLRSRRAAARDRRGRSFVRTCGR
jgi:hypothetical protein